MYKNKSGITSFFSLFLFMFALQISYAQPAKVENNDTAMQNEILQYINQYRKTRGLAPLEMNYKIVIEAKRHSMDMATHKMAFGHQYFTTRIKRLRTQINNSNAGAENIAYNYKNAQDVVKNWLRSPGHKKNIDGNYNLTGIGVARDNKGKLYFTQIFLKTGQDKNGVKWHF